MRKVRCPPGEWTAIMDNFASGMPASWQVRFVPSTEGAVGGEYRERRSYLPFHIAARPWSSGALEASMTFHRGWFDASFRLEVRPDREVVAEIR